MWHEEWLEEYLEQCLEGWMYERSEKRPGECDGVVT